MPVPFGDVAVNLLAADAPPPYRHGLSLLQGWLPLTLQIVAAVVLVAAIGWRSRRWRLIWLPVSLAVGLALAAWAHWYLDSQGLAGDPAPDSLWIWTGLTGFALGVAILGWRTRSLATCRRRGGRTPVPAVHRTGAELVGRVLPHRADRVESAHRGATARRDGHDHDRGHAEIREPCRTTAPSCTVDIPDTGSGFKHRTELVYLPPRWFATNPPPKLPVVMMIAGEFNTPADWLRTGNAAAIVDDFAKAHNGNAPVMVFVDAGGSFNNDTECVNGPRGNVADHLTKDVVPYVNANFGTSSQPADWGIVGWSMGGTCAVDLTVMHPELFSSFVDIAGDMGPNAGTKDQTIARLYDGDADGLGALRSDHGDHQTWSLPRCFRLVRDLHRRAEAVPLREAPTRSGSAGATARETLAIRPKPRTRCARSARPTG